MPSYAAPRRLGALSFKILRTEGLERKLAKPRKEDQPNKGFFLMPKGLEVHYHGKMLFMLKMSLITMRCGINYLFNPIP